MNRDGGILIVSVNWLGDACMSMPAIQVFREQHPEKSITILTKPPLVPLWQMHAAINHIITLQPGNMGLLKTARVLQSKHFEVAYLLPNSWRSALVPFLAGIPIRVGTDGHHRGCLLNRKIKLSAHALDQHQQWEYVDILQLGSLSKLPPPTLTLPPDHANGSGRHRHTHPITGLIPGAARGTSKQWPESHFVSAARLIKQQADCQFQIFGTNAESAICNRIASALQPDAESFAGRTTLAQLAESLARCDTVICNDSGGMHLAAATGTPVVAIYGLTDPLKTGPLGERHQCIQADSVKGSRKIARHDAAASTALARILPEHVAAAAIKNLTHIRPS